VLDTRRAAVPTDDTNDQISMLLIDSQFVVRDGLRVLLDTQDDFNVVGQAPAVNASMSLDVKPDLVLTDINLPDIFGTEVIRTLAAYYPQAMIAVLSEIPSPSLVQDAFSAGAKAYLLKSASPEELFEALRRVARGHSYLQPQLGFELARWQASVENGDDANSGALTRDETAVLRYLALGHTNKEIARLRGRSLRTVESQRAQILQKLGYASRAELVRYAHEHGITESPRWVRARAG
jgi:DNA-binding NarL/FixJ family response regulator